MKQGLRWICYGLFALYCAASYAQISDRQDLTAIQKAVERYLNVQTNGLPGKVTYSVGGVDPRMSLPSCPALEVFLPPGARLWGATSVGVRCNGTTPWNIYVTASVHVTGQYLVTARPVAQGETITEDDLTQMQGDLTQLPTAILTTTQQAIGKTAAGNLSPGQPLRQDMLRAPLLVQQGQSVKLQSAGSGFTVSAEGRALNNAHEGQVVQVRTASGQTISGIARAAGLIEVHY